MRRSLTLDLPSLDDPAAVARLLRCSLASARVVHFRGPAFGPETISRWEEIARGIGVPQYNRENGATGLPNGELWVDVRFRPEMQSTFRHSRTAQPLHTDDAYKAPENHSNYVLLVVERQARSGGDTVFIDAAELAEYLGDRQPAFLRELASTPVTFAKGGPSKTVPILKPAGDGWEVTFNFYNVDPGSPPEAIALSERFRALLLDVELNAQIRFGFRLDDGEGLIWHDRRVLHGRTAFEAEFDGDRILWKTCIR